MEIECDGCGGDAGPNGWMVPTGRTDPELNVPIVKIACSQECLRKLEAEVAA